MSWLSYDTSRWKNSICSLPYIWWAGRANRGAIICLYVFVVSGIESERWQMIQGKIPPAPHMRREWKQNSDLKSPAASNSGWKPNACCNLDSDLIPFSLDTELLSVTIYHTVCLTHMIISTVAKYSCDMCENDITMLNRIYGNEMYVKKNLTYTIRSNEIFYIFASRNVTLYISMFLWVLLVGLTTHLNTKTRPSLLNWAVV